MDIARWPLVKDPFNDALDLSGEVRRAFLESLDDSVRADVQALLAADEGLLDAPLGTWLIPTDVLAADLLPSGVELAPPSRWNRRRRSGSRLSPKLSLTLRSDNFYFAKTTSNPNTKMYLYNFIVSLLTWPISASSTGSGDQHVDKIEPGG